VAHWIRDLLSHSQPGSHTTAHGSSANARRTRNSQFLESSVKKTLLRHTMDLCSFFGPESAVDKLLMQLLTFLNEQVGLKLVKNCRCASVFIAAPNYYLLSVFTLLSLGLGVAFSLLPTHAQYWSISRCFGNF
jgi:hypothetical protein